MLFEPILALLKSRQLGFDVLPETRRMIVLHKMSELMDNHIIDNVHEGIDQKDITDALRIKFAREKLARECADTDAGVVFGSVKITSSIGKSAWAVFAFTGYLRSDIEFFGIFADLEALTERLMKDGYVSAENADDTVAWITDEQILKLWSR